MNIKQITLLVLVALVSAGITFLLVSKGFISFSDTTIAKLTSTPEVKLKINSAGTYLEVDSIDGGTDPDLKKCRNTNKKNCIRVKRGYAGLVAYTLNKDDHDKGWVLTQFTICRGPNKIKTSCSVDLDRNERLEFFIMNNAQGDITLLTPKSGEVYLNQLKDDSLKKFFLFDQNTIRRDYFYNIQACKPETETEPKKCLTLDPPIENKGRR